MIITIDGPAGTGKSTAAHRIAKILKFQMLDTGALYRAVSAACLSNQIDPKNDSQISTFIRSNPLTVNLSITPPSYTICNVNVYPELRSQAVNGIVSFVAANPTVRAELLPLQRALAKGKDIVSEGRDMGTTVFPHADIKFYLTASSHERAKRRFLEMQEKNILPPGTTVEIIEAQIMGRDTIDSNRSASPLKKPDDAIEIDTSMMNLDQVVQAILNHIQSKISSP